MIVNKEKLNMTGAELIAAERKRQIDVEGYSKTSDALYVNGELVRAAVCYVESTGDPQASLWWPWDVKHWKPSNRVRDLTKAGALIAAEIDRLLARKGNDKEGRE